MTCIVESSPYYGSESSPHERPLDYLTGVQGASVGASNMASNVRLKWQDVGSGVAHIQFVRPDSRSPRALRFWTTIRKSQQTPVPPVLVSGQRGLHRSRCSLDLWYAEHPLGGRTTWLIAGWDTVTGGPTQQTLSGWLEQSELRKGVLTRLSDSLDFTAFLEGGRWRVATFQVPTLIRDAMDGVLGSSTRMQPRAIKWSARATTDASKFQFWYKI